MKHRMKTNLLLLNSSNTSCIVSLNSPEGNTFRDPTLVELGDYYGRLLAHYTEGGFVDEGGLWIPVGAAAL